MRMGIGYDIHRLVPTVEESAIPIGGLLVPCQFKVDSHSDGDVLLHALTDACLGALALGDIGQWFPDNDKMNKDRSSSEFLLEVLKEIDKLGWKVQQMDSVLMLEKPKLAPKMDEIRQNLCKLLSTELMNVSVKAKTGEGLGPVGTRKAIAAYATVTLVECR